MHLTEKLEKDMIAYIYMKIYKKSYQEKQRDWPIEASATSVMPGAKSRRLKKVLKIRGK